MAAATAEEPRSLFVATLQDVNQLIDNMQAKTKGKCIGPSFANLAEEWRKMRFSNIFTRSTQEEMMDYTPVTYLATKINILPPTEMERRLYAVLVLYALYIRQPCDKICKIRLTRKEWSFLLELFKYSAENNHKEQCYVIDKMWAENVFDLVYSPIDLTFMLSHRKNLEDLGIVALEAIQPVPNQSVLDSDTKHLDDLIKNTRLQDYQGEYNSLTKNIEGFDQCTVWSQLDKILNGVPPKKKPQYLVFVNSQRKTPLDNEEDVAVPNIGVRRQALKSRKSKRTEEPAPAPNPKPRRNAQAPPDPNFAFVYSSGSRTLHKSILAKTSKIKKLNAQLVAEGGDNTAAGEKSDNDMAAAELALLEYEEVLTERDNVPADDVNSNSDESMDETDPSSQKDVLKDALSMPVVEWHDPD